MSGEETLNAKKVDCVGQGELYRAMGPWNVGNVLCAPESESSPPSGDTAPWMRCLADSEIKRFKRSSEQRRGEEVHSGVVLAFR